MVKRAFCWRALCVVLEMIIVGDEDWWSDLIYFCCDIAWSLRDLILNWRGSSRGLTRIWSSEFWLLQQFYWDTCHNCECPIFKYFWGLKVESAVVPWQLILDLLCWSPIWHNVINFFAFFVSLPHRCSGSWKFCLHKKGDSSGLGFSVEEQQWNSSNTWQETSPQAKRFWTRITLVFVELVEVLLITLTK